MNQWEPAPAPTKTEFDTLNSTVSSLSDQIANHEITATYSDTQLSDVQVIRNNKIICITGKVLANVLTAGFNNIPISIPNTSTAIIGGLSFMTGGSADDSKQFWGITTNSSIQIRASASNSVGLSFYGYFISST